MATTDSGIARLAPHDPSSIQIVDPGKEWPTRIQLQDRSQKESL
jgi:hypothetical protein